jgi:hypothetical protein
MNKLWVFGDSFSATYKRNNLENWRIKYKNWKGYIPNVFGDFLSLKIKYKLNNCALSGVDNYTLFENIIDVIDSIKENDVVIIGWSSTLRFRLVNKNNSFTTIRPNDLNLDDTLLSTSTISNVSNFNNVSLNTLSELILNRDSVLFQYELNRFIKIINLYLENKCKVIHWSPFQYMSPNLNIHRINPLSNVELIKDETNGEVDDLHYSENGHKQLADYFYEYIKNSYE